LGLESLARPAADISAGAIFRMTYLEPAGVNAANR
jgi:hypothetical protein